MMKSAKKLAAAGAVALVLVAGVGTPAQAAPVVRVQPQGASFCDIVPWWWGCR